MAFALVKDFTMNQLQRLHTAGSLEDVQKNITHHFNSIEGSAEEKVSALTLAIRVHLQELLRHAQESRKRLSMFPLTDLFDFTISAAQHSLTEKITPFILYEDLFESQTIPEIADVFSLLESRVHLLTEPEFFDKGKLTLLRTCNAILRRLSKTHDTSFCGRVLMLLTAAYPLGDRSGVNLKSLVNTSNTTAVEDGSERSATVTASASSGSDVSAMDIEGAAQDMALDFKFYRDFWSLQTFFADNAQLFVKVDNWAQFSVAADKVLSAFESQSLEGEGGSGGSMGSATHPKYLTSSKLLALQMRDSNFRRNILIQFLTLVHAVLNPVTVVQEKWNKALTDKMKSDLNEYRDRVYKLLDSTPPEGKTFSANIAHIMQRENNWVAWKKAGCFVFEKPVRDKFDSELTPQPLKRRRPKGASAQEVMKYLSRRADEQVDGPVQTSVPTFQELWEPIFEELDPDNCIEDAYKKKNDPIYSWKALRVLSRSNLNVFLTVYNGDVEDCAREIMKTDKSKQAVQTGIEGSDQVSGSGASAEDKMETEEEMKKEDGENTTPNGADADAGDLQQELEEVPMEEEAELDLNERDVSGTTTVTVTGSTRGTKRKLADAPSLEAVGDETTIDAAHGSI
eukprot:GILK01009564.1.p1 GENE.GILK01009564.1~~GILK01009564.1.p1  ORF type:complete len:634 (-),score=139.18 GILK01009564.1:14-1888(-)